MDCFWAQHLIQDYEELLKSRSGRMLAPSPEEDLMMFTKAWQRKRDFDGWQMDAIMAGVDEIVAFWNLVLHIWEEEFAEKKSEGTLDLFRGQKE